MNINNHAYIIEENLLFFFFLFFFPQMLPPDYIPVDMQGVVLSSYFYGYIITPFFGGFISERLGAKRVLTVAMIMSATLTLLTPLAIRINIYLTVVLRILLGLFSVSNNVFSSRLKKKKKSSKRR